MHDTLSPDDLCAEALRRALREMPRYLPAMIDRNDAKQEASLGILKAVDRIDAERTTEEQINYLTRTGVGAMKDAVRSARPMTGMGRLGRGGAADPGVVELDSPADADDGVIWDLPIDPSQDAHVQTMRACDAIARMPAPLPAIVLMKLAGMDNTLIATHLGYSHAGGRVGQMLKDVIRRLGAQ